MNRRDFHRVVLGTSAAAAMFPSAVILGENTSASPDQPASTTGISGTTDLSGTTEISASEMQSIYEEVKTPYKYGVVIPQMNGNLVDCPSIFRKDDQWYMVFICGERESGRMIGYQTYIARSTDLLKWTIVNKIMTFPKTGWDSWQVDAGISLVDPTWGGSAQFQPFDNKYWFTYIGGHQQGYEPDPLSIGVAWTDDPTSGRELVRYDRNPILRPSDESARWFEKRTLYKSTVIWDRPKTLGSQFVMYYNAKGTDGTERIGIALSDDMITWRRYLDNPVIDTPKGPANHGISGDPQIVRIGDYWVMFYFGAFYQPGAFDTFAVSKDMVHWTRWTGEHLVKPSQPYDSQYAHKPWLLKHDGVVYHFYCAVGNQGRTIALATSKKL